MADFFVSTEKRLHKEKHCIIGGTATAEPLFITIQYLPPLMKQYLLIFTIIGSLMLSGQLYAESGSDDSVEEPSSYSDDNNDRRPLPPVRLKNEREKAREQMKEEREKSLEEFKMKRDSQRELVKEKRESFFEEAKQVRDEMKAKRETLTEMSKEEREQARETFKQTMEAKREAFKTEIETIKKEKVSVRKAFVETRFNQVIVVLTSAQERIGTKMTELEGKGYDMTEANTHLDESKTSLAEAKALLTTLSSTTVSDADETSATKPRETAKKIEGLLKETRMHLVEAIKSMRDSVNPSSDDETTDATNEDDSVTTN